MYVYLNVSNIRCVYVHIYIYTPIYVCIYTQACIHTSFWRSFWPSCHIVLGKPPLPRRPSRTGRPRSPSGRRGPNVQGTGQNLHEEGAGTVILNSVRYHTIPLHIMNSISSHLMWSRLIPSHLIPFHPIASNLISSRLISFCFVSCHRIPSHFITSDLTTSRLITSHLITSYFIIYPTCLDFKWCPKVCI